MTQRSPLSTILSGVAGEYFVAGELSRRGYVASITLRNTRGIDILASNSDATKTVGIQVKTHQGTGKDWIVSKTAEGDSAENLFYVFVRLNALSEPTYFVVPRKVVAEYARENHARWLSTPGRNGKPHADGDMRKFADPANQYLGRWDLLGLD